MSRGREGAVPVATWKILIDSGQIMENILFWASLVQAQSVGVINNPKKERERENHKVNKKTEKIY